MNTDEIKALIESSINTKHVEVQTDGSHVSVLVVSEEFEGLNAVKKQQRVYAGLNEAIASGAIHAVQIKALTPAEWS